MKTAAAYREYLKSDHWRRLRALALSRDRESCKWCGSKHRLEVHHHFYRSSWYDTQLDDLVTLCPNCHDVAHGKIRKRPAKRKKYLNRLEKKMLRQFGTPFYTPQFLASMGLRLK
jgi:5-methylcytosine-specific restriction endonuclease McrA